MNNLIDRKVMFTRAKERIRQLRDDRIQTRNPKIRISYAGRVPKNSHSPVYLSKWGYDEIDNIECFSIFRKLTFSEIRQLLTQKNIPDFGGNIKCQTQD